MDKKVIEQLNKQLLNTRKNLLDLVSNKSQDLADREVGDSIDIAADSAEREMLFELTDIERNILNDIDNAIQKIEHGSYSKCEGCGDEIAEARLKVIPAARLCIKCQTKLETKKK